MCHGIDGPSKIPLVSVTMMEQPQAMNSLGVLAVRVFGSWALGVLF